VHGEHNLFHLETQRARQYEKRSRMVKPIYVRS
jgi:hypothetical protein